jgi:hypothetical protein
VFEKKPGFQFDADFDKNGYFSQLSKLQAQLVEEGLHLSIYYTAAFS